jgi:predicted benzoate:H+ symporter BenE
MKTIAAVALASPGLSLPEVMAAGLFVGGVMLLLGVTGAMDLVNRAVPGSIVRGIQLAVGLQLAQKVWELVWTVCLLSCYF